MVGGGGGIWSYWNIPLGLKVDSIYHPHPPGIYTHGMGVWGVCQLVYTNWYIAPIPLGFTPMVWGVRSVPTGIYQLVYRPHPPGIYTHGMGCEECASWYIPTGISPPSPWDLHPWYGVWGVCQLVYTNWYIAPIPLGFTPMVWGVRSVPTGIYQLVYRPHPPGIYTHGMGCEECANWYIPTGISPPSPWDLHPWYGVWGVCQLVYTNWYIAPIPLGFTPMVWGVRSVPTGIYQLVYRPHPPGIYTHGMGCEECANWYIPTGISPPSPWDLHPWYGVWGVCQLVYTNWYIAPIPLGFTPMVWGVRSVPTGIYQLVYRPHPPGIYTHGMGCEECANWYIAPIPLGFTPMVWGVRSVPTGIYQLVYRPHPPGIYTHGMGCEECANWYIPTGISPPSPWDLHPWYGVWGVCQLVYTNWYIAPIPLGFTPMVWGVRSVPTGIYQLVYRPHPPGTGVHRLC